MRSRSSDCSGRRGSGSGRGSGEGADRASVKSRVSAIEARTRLDETRAGRSDDDDDDDDEDEDSPKTGGAGQGARDDSGAKSPFDRNSARRRSVHGRPRSSSLDRRLRNGGVTSAPSYPPPPPRRSSGSVTPSPSSTPSPGFQLPSPLFPPPPDSALPHYDEAVERIKLLRWTSLQKLPTSRGVSGTCGGRSADARRDSNEGSDDVFTSDDDVRTVESDVAGSVSVTSAGQVSGASSRLESRKTSSSKRIVLEVLV